MLILFVGFVLLMLNLFIDSPKEKLQKEKMMKEALYRIEQRDKAISECQQAGGTLIFDKWDGGYESCQLLSK